MNHAKNKLKWCLRKAEKELEKDNKHRGLIKKSPNIELAKKHIAKAEHYLKATTFLKDDFSDISASTAFYCMYQCLLAIALKQGYESRNQECTFALIEDLIEENKIDFNIELLEKISSLNPSENTEHFTSIEIREQYQYGTDLSLNENLYNELFSTAQEVLLKTKEIIESQI